MALVILTRMGLGQHEGDVVIESPGYTVSSLPAGVDFMFVFNAESNVGLAPFSSQQIFEALQYFENALNSRRSEWQGR